jgi:hypothetical protein
MKIALRLSIVVVLGLLFLMGATSLLAASPEGASPDDGLAPTCTYQPLDPGASVWLKIPYESDYRLQFTLDAYSVGRVMFQVYASDTASDPVGIGTYDRNNPAHDLNWEGRLQANGFFYVLVTNTNPFSVPYRFCVNQKQPFYSPLFIGCVNPPFYFMPGPIQYEGFRRPCDSEVLGLP